MMTNSFCRVAAGPFVCSEYYLCYARNYLV